MSSWLKVRQLCQAVRDVLADGGLGSLDLLATEPAEEVGTALKRIEEQLRAEPRRGLGFGLLRYLGSGEVSTRLREMRRAPSTNLEMIYLLPR